MRLTLRTLLAYLDGILEPNDAQDLGKKVEESEYATGLVHRIRDVLRRLRLGAPDPIDHEQSLDPNTVAEYLDNTLTTDRVADFEKVCLDSDVHLAEVASCHQILTLVLGEPAEVEPECRERVYQVKNSNSPTGPQPPPAPPALPTSPALSASAARPSLDLGRGGDAPRSKNRNKPTVPEYLREPRKRPAWLPVAAVAVLVVCASLFLLKMLGQFEPGTPLGNMMVQWGMLDEPKEETKQVAQNDPQEPTHEGVTETVQPDTPPSDTDASANKEPEPVVPPVKEPSTSEPSKEPAESTKPVTPPPANLPSEPEEQKTPIEEDQPTETPSTETPPTESGTETPVEPAESPQVEQPAAPETSEPVEPKTTPEPQPDPELPPTPEPLGRLMSSNQVLLSATADGDWVRVGPNQMLVPQQIILLPTYRAKVALTIGVTLELIGPARVELQGSDAAGLSGIRIFYGRVVLMPIAKPDARLRVAFGDHAGTLTFVDADSAAAIDVRRLRAPGTDPETGPSRIAAELYAGTGDLLWEETTDPQAGKPVRLAPLQQLTFDAHVTSEPTAVKKLPKWTTSQFLSALDRRASAAIAKALPNDRPARVGLLELATTRPQKEVRWLALRSLGYLGQFRDMVAALNEPSHRLEWADFYVDVLRAAVARDAETAAAIREDLEKQYPDQASSLYRMLWGYSNADLEAGEDANLVQALSDETLAVRVLAIWNLKDITGLGQLYQPEQTAAKRQLATRRWQERLDDKEIRLKGTEKKAGD